MADTRSREKAITLRARGSSIAEIASALGKSKSTVSFWCRDITLSPAALKRIALRQARGGHAGRLRAAELKRAARISAEKSQRSIGKRDVAHVSARDLHMIGLALYWGEGNKGGNEECGLTNSNPDIIRVCIRWLRTTYGIRRDDLIARVSIHAMHAARIADVEKYWSAVTGIHRAQFSTSSIIRATRKKMYANNNVHMGTLRIKVRRATALRRRILGSIAEIARQVGT